VRKAAAKANAVKRGWEYKLGYGTRYLLTREDIADVIKQMRKPTLKLKNCPSESRRELKLGCRWKKGC